MKEQRARTVYIILLAVFIVFSFVPCIFVIEYWVADTPGVGIYTLEAFSKCNIFLVTSSATVVGRMIAIVTLIITIAGVFALIMQYTGKRIQRLGEKTLKQLAAAPILLPILWIILAVVAIDFSSTPIGAPGGTATSGYYGHFSYSIAWGFYIECTLVLAIAIVGYCIATGKFSTEESDAPEILESKNNEIDLCAEHEDDKTMTQNNSVPSVSTDVRLQMEELSAQQSIRFKEKKSTSSATTANHKKLTKKLLLVIAVIAVVAIVAALCSLFIKASRQDGIEDAAILEVCQDFEDEYNWEIIFDEKDDSINFIFYLGMENELSAEAFQESISGGQEAWEHLLNEQIAVWNVGRAYFLERGISNPCNSIYYCNEDSKIPFMTYDGSSFYYE